MNILLTSVGRRSYLVNYFREALGSSGLVFAGNSVPTHAQHLAHEQVATPLIADEDYIPFLLEFCRINKIRLLVPLLDSEIPLLSMKRDAFSELGTTVLSPAPEHAMLCFDKLQAYQFLNKLGIATPHTVTDLASARRALADEQLQFPLLLKPRAGMGSQGQMKVNSVEELEVDFARLGMNLSTWEFFPFEKEDQSSAVLIQQFVKGQEYGLDVFNDLNGRTLCSIPKLKIAIRAGETEVAEIVDDEELVRIGEQIGFALKHRGNLDVDLIRGDEGWQVIDLNCRFGGQYPFSHLAGANFPQVLVDLMQGKEANLNHLTVTPGIRGVKDLAPVISSY